MSWTDELYKIYDLNISSNNSQEVLLPVSHSTANAQIEITINEKGEFVTARQLDKSEAVTIIPVTEASGSRSSGVAPMPLADKLIYIAGDYKDYVDVEKADDLKKFDAYIKQLEKWADGEYSHNAVKAIYTYLKKSCIIKDLISRGVLILDNEIGKLDKSRISGIEQKDSFVRFFVEYQDLLKENRTWLDESLYESFINFNRTLMTDRELCYATGEVVPCTYKHPSKIRNSGDKAKLISANDESGFSYRGRFSNKEEAISVGYEFSQKMHNALKWLVEKQGMNFENSLMLVIWASSLEPLPDIRKSFSECYDEEYLEEEELVPKTEPLYKSNLQKMIFGYKDKMNINSKVMIMGLDAATTGRMSISMYSELEGSRFLNNVEKWHSEISWLVYNTKKKVNNVDSFSVYQIAKCAYGTEQNEKLVCKSELMTETVMRLVPCITEGRRFPQDIMKSLVIKASNPLAYEKDYNHRMVVETACGMIRKCNFENKKGVTSMALDENITERSYLFGRLLAVADKAESDTYEKEEQGKRITNARRYWNKFSLEPAGTWQIISERLNPYMTKLGESSKFYNKLMSKIMDKFEPADFASAKKLEPLYLLGYHCQMSKLYEPKKDKQINQENED